MKGGDTMSKNTAPYGYRLDGKPKKKPGRKTDKQRAHIAAKKNAR